LAGAAAGAALAASGSVASGTAGTGSDGGHADDSATAAGCVLAGASRGGPTLAGTALGAHGGPQGKNAAVDAGQALPGGAAAAHPAGAAPAQAADAVQLAGRFAAALDANTAKARPVGAAAAPIGAASASASAEAPGANLLATLGLSAAATSPVTASGTAPAVVVIPTAVSDPGFGTDVGHQLATLARTGTQSAQLTLNPEHWGPVSVQIQMNGLQASLSIAASHEATREALRAALPQLQQMFSQSGLQLGGAQVGDGSQGQYPPRFGTPAPMAQGVRSASSADSVTVALVPAAARAGLATRLIDTFA